jgi:hypothetical protein
MNKILLSKIVKINHKFFFYFVIFGFLLPSKYLLCHLFAWPTIFLHWKTNNNRCWISELEDWLLSKKTKPVYRDYDGIDSDFVKLIFRRIGLNVTNHYIHMFIVLIFKVSWSISAMRYFLYLT